MNVIMKTKQKSEILNRFTTLPELLHLLRRSEIVLRNPNKWEDKNDSINIINYMKKTEKQIFAICFCREKETIHHWKAYANGTSGCCIEFDKETLLESFPSSEGFRKETVDYKTISDIIKTPGNSERRLFLKRELYQFEKEFRIIWEGKTNDKLKRVKIDLNSINKITISQQMPPDLFKSIRITLRHLIDNPSLKINQSTVYKNNTWIKKLKKL
jgi:hypothetical protein